MGRFLSFVGAAQAEKINNAREVLSYWMVFIDSEQDDERQAPWVTKARELLAKLGENDGSHTTAG